MGRKGSNKKSSTKTVVNTIQQLSHRTPRINLRGSLSDNVTMLTGNQYLNSPSVAVGQTLGYGQLRLTPGNAAGFSSYPVETVAAQFQNGLYLPGTKLDYYPAVGLNTSGSLIIAYVDSPTTIKQWNSVAAGSHLAYIQGLSNVKTGPLWQTLTFPLPSATRRKDYAVDNSVVVNDTNEIDLAVQGMFVWCIYGVEKPVTDPKTFGQMVLHTRMRCRELVGFAQQS